MVTFKKLQNPAVWLDGSTLALRAGVTGSNPGRVIGFLVK